MSGNASNTEAGWIELKPGVPWCTHQHLNRLMRQQGLCLAVAQAAIYDEIVSAVSLSSAEEEELVRRYLEGQGVKNAEQRLQLMQARGWEESDLRYFATKGARLRQFQNQVFGQEIELRFLERKLDLDRISYSLIRVKEAPLATELHQQLLEGEASFADLATAHSEGQERLSGGRIGPISLTEAHPELVRRLRVSQPGQLWPPFYLVNVWVIVRLDQWHPASLDEVTRQTMLQELFEAWLQRRVKQLLAGETPPPLPTQLLSRPDSDPESSFESGSAPD